MAPMLNFFGPTVPAVMNWSKISGELSRCFRDAAFALQGEPGIVPPGD